MKTIKTNQSVVLTLREQNPYEGLEDLNPIKALQMHAKRKPRRVCEIDGTLYILHHKYDSFPDHIVATLLIDITPKVNIRKKSSWNHEVKSVFLVVKAHPLSLTIRFKHEGNKVSLFLNSDIHVFDKRTRQQSLVREIKSLIFSNPLATKTQKEMVANNIFKFL